MLTLDANGLCLAQTLDCGQCFRWQPQPDGSWAGVVEGRAVQAWQEDGRLCLAGLAGIGGQEQGDTLGGADRLALNLRKRLRARR